MAGLGMNKKFFNSWSPEMSYILGFIVADGCVGIKRIKRDGTKKYFFNITSKDKSHLRNIQKAMKAEQKLYSKRSGYRKRKDCYCIQIGHQEPCKDLINLGIVPRKTYNLQPINVPEKYFPDFTRGFFDGDGSVYIYRVNGTPQLKVGFISTSLNFITEFNQQLCKHLNIPSKTIHRKTDKRRIGMIQYYISFYVDDCEKLINFMYGNNPTLHLLRKRRIFENWGSVKRRHYIKQNYPSKIGWRLRQKIFVLK